MELNLGNLTPEPPPNIITSQPSSKSLSIKNKDKIKTYLVFFQKENLLAIYFHLKNKYEFRVEKND